MHRSIHQYFTNCSFELGQTENCRAESGHAARAICVDLVMVTHIVSLLVFGNLKHGVFKWWTSWPIWINLVKKGRAEYVGVCHWKNWNLNWSHPGFRIKLKTKTFADRAWHSQTQAFVSDLFLFQSLAGFLSLKQFLLFGTIYGKQTKEQSPINPYTYDYWIYYFIWTGAELFASKTSQTPVWLYSSFLALVASMQMYS